MSKIAWWTTVGAAAGALAALLAPFPTGEVILGLDCLAVGGVTLVLAGRWSRHLKERNPSRHGENRLYGLVLWIPYWRGRLFIALVGVLLMLVGSALDVRALLTADTQRHVLPLLLAVTILTIVLMTAAGAQRRW